MTKHKINPDGIPSEEILNQISDKDLSLDAKTNAEKERIERLMKFFDDHGIDYGKFNGEVPKVKLDSKAYPNDNQYLNVPGQRDTSKWLETVKEIYFKEKNGTDRVQALRQVTSSWNDTETFDFMNWLRYYESGTHLKYKVAQSFHSVYENGDPGYFLHIKKDPDKTPAALINGNDIDMAKDNAQESMSNSEKKSIIEKQRSKIIGRLDSAEKLLRSTDGQLFAGKELESLMESIYALKKKIQLVNKISMSVRLYEDMIVREANVLFRNGFAKAASTLYSIAQTPGGIPAAVPPAPPSQPSGSVGGLPAMGPGQPQTPPESAPNDKSVIPKKKPKAINEFLNGIETANITTEKDKQVADDYLEVYDDEDVLQVIDNGEELIAKGQEVPAPEAPAPEPTAPVAPESENLEVSEDDINKPELKPATRDFDNIIDAAFANLTVSDVVVKLEDLAKIFKTREVPRQLSLVDMMLDSLGLASYFPSLSEATNKALESNNYISTRIEDILSKLRGSMKTNDIDLKGEEAPKSNSDVDGVKQNLKTREDKEKARKQMRKDVENEELDGKNKETPEIDIEEDMSEPEAPAEKPMPAPAVKPAQPPVTTPKPLV